MLNQVVLMGRLVRDPELRYTASGIASCNITIAVDRKFQNKGSTERQADFISCIAWRERAEFLSKYFKKGSMIAVVGSIQTRTYEKDGVKRYITEVVIDSVSFTGEKRDADSVPYQRSNQEESFQPPAAESYEAFTPVDSDEDLPF